MCLAVLAGSPGPLVLSVAGGMGSPLLYGVPVGVGAVLGYCVVLGMWYRSLFGLPGLWMSLGSRLWCGAIFWCSVSNFSEVLVAMSVRYVDISVAALLFQAWPVVAVVLTGILFRREGRFVWSGVGPLACLGLGLVGVGYVVMSQDGGTGSLGMVSPRTVLGVGLAGAGALAAGAGISQVLRWGVDLGIECGGPGRLGP